MYLIGQYGIGNTFDDRTRGEQLFYEEKYILMPCGENERIDVSILLVLYIHSRMSTLIRISEANCFLIAMTQVKADFRLKQKVLTDSHSRVAHVITVLFRVITPYFHEHHFESQQFAAKSYQTFHSLMIFQ